MRLRSWIQRSPSGLALGASFVVAVLFALSDAEPAASAKPPLVDVTVQPALASLLPGQTLELRAIGHYADGSTADITRKVSFRDDSELTRITKNVLTAKAEGEAEIFAVAKGGSVVSSGTLRLRVSHVVALRIDPDDEGVRLGRETAYRALATLADGTTRVDVTDRVVWSSSDPKVLRVGDTARTKGIARAVRTGQAVLEVFEPGNENEAELAVTVVSELAQVAVDPESRFLQLDDTGRFDAIGSFENGVAADVSADVRWASSDKKIVTVDRFGVATPRRLGVAEVIATEKRSKLSSAAAGANGVISVVGELLSIAVAPTALEIAVGDEERIRAFGTFAGPVSDAFNLGRRVDWFTSDASVAVAEANGDLHCLGPGTATLSARDRESGVTSTATGGDAQVTCAAE